MSRIRTFVAVEISPWVQAQAAALVRQLRETQVKVSWTRPENLHLTLNFLGDVPDAETPEVCRAVAEVCKQHVPFTILFSGAGAFPNAQRPRTLWIGVQQGAAELTRLQADLENALYQLGFPREHRRYNPHLTIGRVRGGGPQLADLAQRLEAHREFSGGETAVDEVLVNASFLDPEGPTYQVLGRGTLEG